MSVQQRSDEAGVARPARPGRPDESLIWFASQSSTAEEHELRKRWLRLRQGQTALLEVTATVFSGSATSPSDRLSSVAYAYAEYLTASRDISDALNAPWPADPSWTSRLSQWITYLESLQTLIGRADLNGPISLPPSPADLDRLAPRPDRPMVSPPEVPAEEPEADTWLERVIVELTTLVAEIRTLLGSLNRDHPRSARAHVALIAAWGRYDNAIADLRRSDTGGAPAETDELHQLREALIAQMSVAQGLCTAVYVRQPSTGLQGG